MGFKMKSLVLGLAIATASLTAGVAYANSPSVPIATFNLAGTDDIFGAGLTGPLVSSVNPGNNNGGEGSTPVELNVTQGEEFWVSATGLVNCCDNSSVPGSGPAGFAHNPFNPSSTVSTITDSLVGGKIGTYTGPIFALVYTFIDGATGLQVGGTHSLAYGSSGYITAPTGATEMFFGFADGYGFGGPSGAYGDNFNSPNAPGITLNVSTAPEPATWALMILGVGLAGGALRMGRREQPNLAVA
jgi:hypothetical protein